MALEVAEIKDLREFTQGFVTDVVGPDSSPAAPFDDTSSGWDMGQADGTRRGGDHIYSVYDHIRDRIYFHCKIIKELPGGVVALRNSTFSRDALCRNTSVGWYRDSIQTYSGTQLRLKIGAPDLTTGVQRVYCFNAAQNNHFEIDQLSGDSLGGADLWPNIPNDFINGSILIGNDGYWAGSTAGNPGQSPFMPIIFEGLTDTTGWEPGNAASNEGILWNGGNSHPKGMALMNTQATDYDSQGGPVGRRWTWIDLDTGEAVGTLGLPSTVNSASANSFAEPTIDGRTWNWTHVQFVPDEDSTPARPKGELHISSAVDTAEFTIAGITVDAPTQSFVSTVSRQFVAVHDFNPYNEQAGIVRVHNRRIFLGFCDIPQEPLIDGGADSTGAQDAENERSINLTYHPPSRTWFNVIARPFQVNSEDPDAPTIGYSRIIRFRRSSVIGSLSQPTPTTAVTENRTINARVIVNTDLGNRAVGVGVEFVLTRTSTRAETFDGTAQGASAYVVDAGEIDDDQTLDVREGNDVDNGGTLLVEGVDYNVTFATGTLTPIGSWPTDSIFVRYRHRGVKLTPPHGQLLNSSAVTDGNGSAFALIRYDDELDGELDVLEATA